MDSSGTGGKEARVLEFEAELVKIVHRVHPDTLAHGRGHVLRVVGMVKRIMNAMKTGGKDCVVDGDVLLAAAYLHDVGRFDGEIRGVTVVPRGSLNHAERSALIAEQILANQPWFPASKIGGVLHAIRAHSFSLDEVPRTMEAKILSDADKLDALGAPGILRTIAYSTERNRTLDETIGHFRDKILLLKDRLHTSYARMVAEPRHRLVQDFVHDLDN
ncbi:MAG: HD domain-containing protein [Promethearchaeota archaeon]